MYRLTLDRVPVAMVQEMSANKRPHWAARSRATKYWRTLTFWQIRGQWPTVPALTKAHITVTIRWPDQRLRDIGNWSPLSKACVDGLVDAGVLPDDSDRYVIGPDMRRDPTRGPVRVVIDVEPLEPDPALAVAA